MITLRLTDHHRAQLLDLLWDALRPTPGPSPQDRRRTGWGNKTQEGLCACIETILNQQETPRPISGHGARFAGHL
jgi:hypothetical protein